MIKYAVVIERGESAYSAYVPDLPGCTASAATRDELDGRIAEAIALHIQNLREQGQEIPHPRTEIQYVQPLDLES